MSGTELSGTIEKHVYGDGENTGGRLGGALYWYTIPVTFPASGGNFDLTLDGKSFQKISVVSVSGRSPLALVSTLWVADYVDGGGTVPDKVTLQISGVGLPGAASEYLCEGTIQDTYERVQIPTESVTPPNQYGYRFVTFDLRGHNLQNTSWNNIEFDGGTYTDQDGSHQVENYGAFFFDPRSHLKQEKMNRERPSISQSLGVIWIRLINSRRMAHLFCAAENLLKSQVIIAAACQASSQHVLLLFAPV